MFYVQTLPTIWWITIGLLTKWTTLRFLPRMNSWVRLESWWLASGFPTQCENVWFLSRMNYWVLLEMMSTTKGLLAQWTHKWFLPRMNSWVRLEMISTTKGLLAQWTHKWFLLKLFQRPLSTVYCNWWIKKFVFLVNLKTFFNFGHQKAWIRIKWIGTDPNFWLQCKISFEILIKLNRYPDPYKSFRIWTNPDPKWIW